MRVAIVGVTGMVGQVMCKILEERKFPITTFIPVASERSVGKQVEFNGQQHTVVSIEDAIQAKPHIALFSAGGSTSKEAAPKFAAVGTIVIDNSSAFRMDKNVPLIVPEVNIQTLKPSNKIIANPNCSTIQLVVALAPLHQAYQIDRLVISTYQSMTGTGVKAVKQYQAEQEGKQPEQKAYPHPIFENCLPHCDVFFENGYTREELKLVNETRKIMNNQDLRITATAVRVPVLGGHSESINVSFHNDFVIEDVRKILENAKGLIVLDNPSENAYPMPQLAHHRDEVFVGRLRRDLSAANTLNMWVVADNLRKGAATNAVQIAEYLLEKGWIGTSSTEMGMDQTDQVLIEEEITTDPLIEQLHIIYGEIENVPTHYVDIPLLEGLANNAVYLLSKILQEKEDLTREQSKNINNVLVDILDTLSREMERATSTLEEHTRLGWFVKARKQILDDIGTVF